VVVAHGFLGQPFRPTLGIGKRQSLWSAALVTILGSMTADLAMTWLCRYDEWRGYQRAAAATAHVTRIEPREWLYRAELVSSHAVTYEFTDAHGDGYQGTFRLRKPYRRPVRPELPAEFVRRIQAGETPFDLSITYDPKWPKHSWPVGVGWRGDGHDLHALSFDILFLQVFGLIALMIILAGVEQAIRGRWWSEFYKVWPLVAEAA
jgi:hypothetical protein